VAPKEQTNGRGALVTKLSFHQEILLFGCWLIIAAAAAATHHSFSGLFIFFFFFDRVDPCVFDVLVPSAAALIDDVIRSCSNRSGHTRDFFFFLGPRCAISVSVMNLPTVKGHPFLCISLLLEKKK
jgi:hypothetical protein